MTALHEPIPGAVRSFLDQRATLARLLDSPASSGLVLSKQHTLLADQLLCALYADALRRAPLAQAPALMLAAVGGYGRGQLGWKSDLDILFVTEGDTAEVCGFIEGLLYPMWNAGIALGHQVMRLDDLIEDARESLPTATALLDFRPLAGSAKLRDELRTRASEALFDPKALPDFIARLVHEVDGRRRRFGDSVYLLEPDVKNGAGGLRDIDVASWVARAGFPGARWSELVQAEVLTAAESLALQEATEFVYRVRNLLHQIAERRNDRLTFDVQEQVAHRLDYGIDQPQAEDEVERVGRMVEMFMSDYYRHAHAVTRAQERIISRVLDKDAPMPGPVRRLRPGVITQGGKLGFEGLEILERTPELALDLYIEACRRSEPVMPSARDAVSQLTAGSPEFCAALRASPRAANAFLELLCSVADAPFRNGSVLSELHAVGLLVAMIPEFVPVIGRVHHDLYHVYTVDVHSVAAVDYVRGLMRGEWIAKYPRACRVAAEATQPQRLYLAALLHDIGKVFGGREHSERGAVMVRAILQRFALSDEDIEHVAKLVRLHLNMYFVAARRDLTDPATIEQFAAEVGDLDCLRDLYLLTIADISTTAPDSMTTWKSRMLDELYISTHDHLAGAAPGRSLARARAQLFETGTGHVAKDALEAMLTSVPPRYLLSNTPLEIVSHAEALEAARGKRLHVQLVPSRHDGIAELCVVTGLGEAQDAVGDRPGLLATIAAALTACNIRILAAQIYTCEHASGQPCVLDVFCVRHQLGDVERVREQLPEIQRALERLLSGELTFDDVLKRRTPARWSDRPAPAVATEVSIDSTSSAEHTIIEVVAQDKPGLLFKLAHTLHQAGMTITFAKVNTEGNRVIDIFYVSPVDGSGSVSRKQAQQLVTDLKAAV